MSNTITTIRELVSKEYYRELNHYLKTNPDVHKISTFELNRCVPINGRRFVRRKGILSTETCTRKQNWLE